VRAKLIDPLCAWFDDAARDLPWRRRRNGYRALVAEAMLQQTQVARVVGRYESFLRAFPNVRALAEADEQAVLAAWQGLGYYRRARSLHAAAQVIVDRHRGRVPRTASVLRELPGVGAYTAGSIASIVYGEAAPIVDGNVARVLARWFGSERAPDGGEGRRWTWGEARRLVEMAERPGVFNEAMMELGATVCTPRSPSCAECPVARGCEARRAGRQDELPVPKSPPRRTEVHHHAVVIERAGRVLLERRPAEGLWASMWQVPTVEAERRLGPQQVEGRLGFRLSATARVEAFVYQTTHRRITFHVFSARSRRRLGTWRRPDDLGDLPMSNAMRRVLRVAS
jgi:A/G-specific adenine glycosylase